MKNKSLQIAVTGTANSGKTSLCNAIAGRSVNEGITVTIGIDLIIENVTLDGASHRLLLWELGGQCTMIALKHLSLCQIMLLCLDATNLHNPRKLEEIYRRMEPRGHRYIIMVLNKSDSNENLPEVVNKARLLSKKIGCPLVKTSALTGEGVKELVRRICRYNNLDIFKKTLQCHPELDSRSPNRSNVVCWSLAE